MQFHHNGYVSQSPKRRPAAGYGLNRPDVLPDEMDVLIVGSGPAGAIAAAQLSMFPDVRTHLIERREDRLKLGQADGVQSRSNETFQAFQFATEIIEEAYHLVEMSFWNPDPENPENIIRTAHTIDDEFGISEFPHTIVNQARVLDYFMRFAYDSPTRLTPDYGWEFISLTVNEGEEYPVVSTVKNVETEETREIRSKYVIGADGARSRVRKSIGRSLAGDQANQAWGVMDVVVDTDFPDWRTKCAIHSKAGSILHIPREGGFLCRIYVDLGTVPADDNHQIRNTPIEDVIAKANEIYHPYYIDVKNVAWHSIYEVGHRLVDGFDNVNYDEDTEECPRVFLTGDACHTHSAKAGQGMNVSMQDGWNISWKLGQVISGRAPESLLRTYHEERQPAAQNLINFDKEWSTLMATPADQLEDPQAVEKYYVEAEEFAAGMLTTYEPSMITGSTEHQDLAEGFPVGRRFKSHISTRFCDGVPMQIGHEHVADGRYRVYVFADSAAPGTEDSQVESWADTVLADVVRKHTPEELDDNTFLDIKVIYQQHHWDFELADTHELFKPVVGTYQVPLFENIWTPTKDQDIFAGRGICRDGAVVIVRPDHYVAAVLPLNEPQKVVEYFDTVFAS